MFACSKHVVEFVAFKRTRPTQLPCSFAPAARCALILSCVLCMQASVEAIALGLLGEGGKGGFIKAGVEYRIGDFMYLHPATFDQVGDGWWCRMVQDGAGWCCGDYW